MGISRLFTRIAHNSLVRRLGRLKPVSSVISRGIELSGGMTADKLAKELDSAKPVNLEAILGNNANEPVSLDAFGQIKSDKSNNEPPPP